MTWFKVDDKFWSHPKVLDVSLAARGLWTTAGTYCAAHLTDGAIEARLLHRITPGSTAQVDRLAAELVYAGLWCPTDTGWAFHDWCDHQPTRSTVDAKRQATADRVRRWRERQTTDPP